MTRLVTLSAGEQTLVLNPDLGGRAISWRVAGSEILGSKSDNPIEFGMYPMGPWAGRLEANTLSFENKSYSFPASYEDWAIHGTSLPMLWNVENLSPHSCTLRCELGQTWPWQGEFSVSWELNEHELLTHITLTSHSEKFPAVVGMHPWFNTNTSFGNAEWNIKQARLAQRNQDFELSGRLIETSEPHGSFDDAFFAPSGRAVIRWGSELALDIQHSHEWFVIYDQEPEFTCIEPQTGPPNGINDSVIGAPFVVSPGRSLQQWISWKIIRGQQES